MFAPVASYSKVDFLRWTPARGIPGLAAREDTAPVASSCGEGYRT